MRARASSSLWKHDRESRIGRINLKDIPRLRRIFQVSWPIHFTFLIAPSPGGIVLFPIFILFSFSPPTSSCSFLLRF